MSFQKNKYTVIKKAISKELANFVYKYFVFDFVLSFREVCSDDDLI